jgi:hypothetical protein
MTDRTKLPRLQSDASEHLHRSQPSKPIRPSHQKILENLERWANSYELQPPKLPDSRTA